MRSKKGIDEAVDAGAILKGVASLPIREDQGGMTPEQRKVINEIMEKVFNIMKEEGRTLNDKATSWMTKRNKP